MLKDGVYCFSPRSITKKASIIYTALTSISQSIYYQHFGHASMPLISRILNNSCLNFHNNNKISICSAC